jgi:hypothetical protein
MGIQLISKYSIQNVIIAEKSSVKEILKENNVSELILYSVKTNYTIDPEPTNNILVKSNTLILETDKSQIQVHPQFFATILSYELDAS